MRRRMRSMAKLPSWSASGLLPRRASCAHLEVSTSLGVLTRRDSPLFPRSSRMSSRRHASVLALLLAASPVLAAQTRPIEPANIDRSVQPTADFYLYANGGWMKANPIPEDKTDWGGFTELFENNVATLHKILDDAAAQKNATKGSPEQLVGDFYASAMDSARADKEGKQPIEAELAHIDAITT